MADQQEFDQILQNPLSSAEQQHIAHIISISDETRVPKDTKFYLEDRIAYGLIYDNIAYFEPSGPYKIDSFFDFLVEICIGKENDLILQNVFKKIQEEANERDKLYLKNPI